MSEKETLKKIALLAMTSLFSGEEDEQNSLKIKVCSLDDAVEYDNLFSVSIGEPEEDTGDAEAPYFVALVDVEEVDGDEFNCKVLHAEIINDPSENTLKSQMQRENFLRKLKGIKPPDEPPMDDVPLISAVGMDYTTLRDLLAAGKWREADEETGRVMLKVVGSEESGWLSDQDLDNFPCEDLRTIDQLWVKYSNGRFGFSVQKSIWLECGGQPRNLDYEGNLDYEVYLKFGDRIGLRMKDEWKSYNELTFSLNAPEGHLPYVDVLMVASIGCSEFGEFVGAESSLLSRIDTCNL
ncbi:GUN4 domain protein [Crinalium epipsammum PCC 9333]|uniref:GUN4 domain protein n=1 Tax=Crinalium epipsammum PCC 9333 TaxID=1173022 RepID=K9VTU0_9CYAN|nr:GUN4 domain-containing protein [Crinalium epipsammum]AFZ11493.1 GUN4 domain protein [Crinalium epipsammum PCC 9333]